MGLVIKTWFLSLIIFTTVLYHQKSIGEINKSESGYLDLSNYASKGNSFLNDNELELWATYYYIPTVFHDEQGIAILDQNENNTGLKLSPCDWCNAAIQGTVSINKNTRNYLLNYAKRSQEIQYDCRKCAKYETYNGYKETGKVLWQITSGFGKGVHNYNLVPFKTIATDNSIVPYGTVLFIPDAKGIKYETSEGKIIEHDGLFFAGDTGSKIKGNHIDVFLGHTSENPFPFVKSNPLGKFNAYIINDEIVVSKLKKMHE